MRRKIFLTCLITLIITGLTTFILWQYYGLGSDYNYFTAKRDIKNGNVFLICYGPPHPQDSVVMSKYGFEEINLGCIVTDVELNAIEKYNHVVEDYLYQRNGPNWNVQYSKEMDSLYNIALQNLDSSHFH